MPCKDIRENLDIELNAENAIFSYSLSKKTCGVNVGQQGLLVDWVKNIPGEGLSEMHMDDFLRDYSAYLKIRNEAVNLKAEEFILLKHFEILKKAVKVLLGKESATKKDEVVIEFLEFSENNHTKARLLYGVGINAVDNPGCVDGCSGGGCGK